MTLAGSKLLLSVIAKSTFKLLVDKGIEKGKVSLY
jgi:hypothetical protein